MPSSEAKLVSVLSSQMCRARQSAAATRGQQLSGVQLKVPFLSRRQDQAGRGGAGGTTAEGHAMDGVSRTTGVPSVTPALSFTLPTSPLSHQV